MPVSKPSGASLHVCPCPNRAEGGHPKIDFNFRVKVLYFKNKTNPYRAYSCAA